MVFSVYLFSAINLSMGNPTIIVQSLDPLIRPLGSSRRLEAAFSEYEARLGGFPSTRPPSLPGEIVQHSIEMSSLLQRFP